MVLVSFQTKHSHDLQKAGRVIVSAAGNAYNKSEHGLNRFDPSKND